MSADKKQEPTVADDTQRVYPGNLEKGEIKIISAGTFDENGPHIQLLAACRTEIVSGDGKSRARR